MTIERGRGLRGDSISVSAISAVTTSAVTSFPHKAGTLVTDWLVVRL